MLKKKLLHGAGKMLIKVLEHVPQCYTRADGEVIAHVISSCLKRGDTVVVSFAGVYGVPSSFVNAAFISLLDDFTFGEIRARVKFANSTKLINDIIKRRFDFEVNKRPMMEYA